MLKIPIKVAHPQKTQQTTITIICMLSYMRSHNRCRLQKLLSLYFQFKGVSAKGFDTLHCAMGLTMSHKWTSNSVARISANCMAEVKEQMALCPWLMSHDNMQMPFRVFSTRLDNQGEFGNGTAATIYVKPNTKLLLESANERLKQKRAEGLRAPITELEIFDLADASYPKIQEHSVYQVLRLLLDSDEFGFASYSGNKSERLKPPLSVDQLPAGPENLTLQYLLGSVDIPEASYEDNSRLVEEWFRQLGLDSEEDQRRLATKKIVSWVGDQLTVDGLRGLFKFCAEDENSSTRLDFVVL